MTPDFGIVYHLWNHTRAAVNLLERAAGEVGIQHITIPVITSEVTQFRYGAMPDEPYFHTPGGWHYPPAKEAYAATGIRPAIARWCGSRDVLAQVCEDAARLGLRVYFRLDPLVAALTERHAHIRQKNAWGQEIGSAPACVLNPDVRGLLQAAFADLGRYGPAGYELITGSPDTAAISKRPCLVLWNAEGDLVLDLCFCAACRQCAAAAGVDADAAARSARAHIQYLAVNSASLMDRLESDEVLKAYRQVRAADDRAWLGRLPDAFAEQQLYLIYPFGREIDRDPALHKWRWLASLPCTLFRSGAARTYTGNSPVYALSVPLGLPGTGKPHELVRAVHEWAGGAVTFFDFEQLVEYPPQAVTWLKQAVRFARRES